MSEDFKEITQTSAVSAVEPSLYQQIVDIFKEGVSMSKNFAHALEAYHNEGNKNVLFNLGLCFRFGYERTPKSPKLALLCLAEGGQSGHEGAMVHFCIAMGEFNLDKLDLSDKQKEEFQKLNGIFEEKIKEKEAEHKRGHTPEKKEESNQGRDQGRY